VRRRALAFVLLALLSLLLVSISACSSKRSKATPVGGAKGRSKTAAPAAKRALRANETALVNATVIDVKTGGKLTNYAVVFAGDSIVAVVPSTSLVFGQGTAIDVRGKFVIPGLWDMHVHFNVPAGEKLFVANGVTGVRVMHGHYAPKGNRRSDFEMRRAFDAKSAIGPRMVVGSAIIDGPNPVWPNSVSVGSAAQGRSAVNEAVRYGADFIKVYQVLPRDVYMAIADEAKKRRVPFAGHVPDALSAAEAADAGQKSIEHLTDVAVSCSSRESEIRRKLAASRGQADRFEADGARSRRQYYEDAMTTYDAKRAQALFAKFVAKGTWQCPTLTLMYSQSNADQLARSNDSRLGYVPSSTRARWNPATDKRTQGRSPDDYAGMRRMFPHRLKVVGAMHKAGVGLLAGTDESNPFIFAGFSLHDELGWLVKAGLSPMDALRTATLNPARYFGWEAKMGTVAPGKVADLVVLDADPTLAIENTKKIFAVVARGTLYRRGDLDRLLEDARREAGRSR
jgi:imidazolonepropionase-like amidohydrolase